MIGSVVALVHLCGLGAKRQGQHLVAQADAEHRLAAGDQLFDLRYGVFAGGGRVARAVGQQHAIGIAR